MPTAAATSCSAPRPAASGQVLETPLGDIPVYNNVREGLEAGHRFNCGVVYLPPSAADDGVVELIRVNPELEKIFIPTEKMSVHDAREIRAMAQARGIDIFGGNSLGVADSWNQVRIGGALGGDSPGDTLRKGSIAILSNSGGFTTTIAQYLRMAGWGTTTLVSSGKDVYIHYAAPEFAFALGNDERSKAAVLYCEPGGYYELDARVHQAGGGLRRRPLEEQAHARRRPRRRDGRRRRRRGVEGTLVHGEVRRRRAVHARAAGRVRRKGAVVINIAAHSRGADGGDGAPTASSPTSRRKARWS